MTSLLRFTERTHPQELRIEMIGLKHKFLFMHLPKTAGNSIQNILRQYSEDEIFVGKAKQDGVERFGVKSKFGTKKHSRLFEYKKLLDPETYNGLFKFTIVRNPWDRIVSRYSFKNMEKEVHNKADFAAIEEAPFDRDEFIKTILSTPTLESFLLESPPDGGLDFLRDTDLDYVIRFENLQNDFDIACSRIGLPKALLPVRNRSKHKDYRTYYDAETRELVYRQHRNEIDYFGYEC